MTIQADDVTTEAELASTAEPGHTVAPPSGRAITIGGRVVPVMGPSVRDPCLHLALVILSVLTIGTVLLDFRISIPQIVITVLTCAVVEAIYQFVRTGALMWPASGMQTATSTVLVLRVVGVEHGDWWSFEGLGYFVVVAVFGLMTKYFVRNRQGHIFNPSNIALVVAFIVFGSERIEPLDYWWGPFGPRIILAYAVIITGGLVICSRLGLLRMAVAFWITLAIGVGILAAMGQSITTRWSFAPVSGWHLWRTIVLSPETLIFLFFMITDPKTSPRGRVSRVAFGISVGVVSTLLIAPWDTEFGSKVGLLAGLAVMSLARPLLERWLPAPGSDEDRLSGLPGRVLGPRRRLLHGAVLVCGVVLIGSGIAVAGAPNRATDVVAVDDAAVDAAQQQVADHPAADVPIPPITIDPDVAGLSKELATEEGARQLVEALLFNLDVEAEAIATGDADLLVAVDHGQRLVDITELIDAAEPGADRVVPAYEFDTIHLSVVFPGGFQSGPNAGLTVTGLVHEATQSADGTQISSTDRPLDVMFTLRRTTNGTWLTTGTLPPATD